MQFSYLGKSGFKISEITYGNWLTHGSPGRERHGRSPACKASLEAGITTFDTADVYANTGAETVLGEALKGERRAVASRSSRRSSGPPGRRGTTTSASRASTSWSPSTARSTRLQTDYVDLYQAHRFDYETPLEETMQAFADVVRQGKALYIGVSEWTADQLRAGAKLAKELGVPAHLEPAAVLRALARHRAGGRPDLEGARHLADRLVADRAGRAHRQVQARASRIPRAAARPTTRAART